jgi:predicted HicB family RNase H-like nuclease
MSEPNKADEYGSKFNSFKDRFKASGDRKPFQEVKPIKSGKNSEEPKQLMIWVSEKLMKQIKLKAVNEGTSIKDLVTAAIEKYLEAAKE